MSKILPIIPTSFRLVSAGKYEIKIFWSHPIQIYKLL